MARDSDFYYRPIRHSQEFKKYNPPLYQTLLKNCKLSVSVDSFTALTLGRLNTTPYKHIW